MRVHVDQARDQEPACASDGAPRNVTGPSGTRLYRHDFSILNENGVVREHSLAIRVYYRDFVNREINRLSDSCQGRGSGGKARDERQFQGYEQAHARRTAT
jgi:hypothetical protein